MIQVVSIMTNEWRYIKLELPVHMVYHKFGTFLLLAIYYLLFEYFFATTLFSVETEVKLV